MEDAFVVRSQAKENYFRSVFDRAETLWHLDFKYLMNPQFMDIYNPPFISPARWAALCKWYKNGNARDDISDDLC